MVSTINSYSNTLTQAESNVDEKTLWITYKQTKDNYIRNKIVMLYSNLVEIIVKKMYHTFQGKAQIDDVVNNGMIALIKSVESFDIDKGVKFSTYASLRIKGSVIDYVRQQDWVPRTVRDKAKEIDKTFGELKQEFGRDPTHSELAERLGISEKKLEEQLIAVQSGNVMSIEEMLNGSAVEYNIEDKDALEPQLLMLKKEKVKYLAKAIDELSENERLVISLFYYEELKIKDIATVLEITPSRVSQIHSAALIKIKNKMKQYMNL